MSEKKSLTEIAEEYEHKKRWESIRERHLMEAATREAAKEMTFHGPNLAAPTIAQQQALTSISKSLEKISSFLESGGVEKLLQGYAKAQAVNALLGGLSAASSNGRVDARVHKQVAVEIPHLVAEVFKHCESHFGALAKGERSEEVVDGEKEFKEWNKRKEVHQVPEGEGD